MQKSMKLRYSSTATHQTHTFDVFDWHTGCSLYDDVDVAFCRIAIQRSPLNLITNKVIILLI